MSKAKKRKINEPGKFHAPPPKARSKALYLQGLEKEKLLQMALKYPNEGALRIFDGPLHHELSRRFLLSLYRHRQDKE